MDTVLPNTNIIIIDIVSGVRSLPGGRTEILFPGYEVPMLAGKNLLNSTGSARSMGTAERVLARMGYTLKLSPSTTKEFPSDPESYLIGEIVRIKGHPSILSLEYHTGEPKYPSSRIEGREMIFRCVIEDVSEIEVLSK